MEKYIIILFIIAIIYYIHLKLKEPEGFENVPAQSLGGVDDTNAINTLAQISKQLMTGGITVPGNINISGNDNGAITGPNGNTRINARGIMFGASNNGYEANSAQITAGLHVPDSLCIVGMGKSAGERKIDMWAEKGATIYGGLTVSALTVNGNLNPAHSTWHTSTDGKHRLHYGNNSHTFYKTADAHVWRNRDDHDRMVLDHNANLRVDGGLTVGGDFIRSNHLYRKHDIAGYFHIRAYGWRTPLYYGFNMMWNDHNVKEAIRRKWGWNESMFSHSIHDMRQHGDANWQARYLVVFPGYKIKIYSWDGSFIDRLGIKGVGEHAFPDTNQVIHGAFVSLAEEGDPPNRIDW